MSGSLGQKNFKLVDVQRVPAQGNFHRAIVTVPEGLDRTVSCDVVICGGGLGGVAAALTASAEGVSTCLLEETDWLGGQATSQGVSALDEHDWIESFGGTRTYYEFRRRIREVYAQRWLGKEHPGETLNPGECWVSRLGFEPRVARAVIEDMLAPARATGSLQVFLRTKVYHCEGAQGSITGVHAVNLETWICLKQAVGVRCSFPYGYASGRGEDCRSGAGPMQHGFSRNDIERIMEHL